MSCGAVGIWLVKRLQDNGANTSRLVDNPPQRIIQPNSLLDQGFLVDLLLFGLSRLFFLIDLGLGIRFIFHVFDAHNLTQPTASCASSWRRWCSFTFAPHRMEPNELADSARTSRSAAGPLHEGSDARELLLLDNDVNINNVHSQTHCVSCT